MLNATALVLAASALLISLYLLRRIQIMTVTAQQAQADFDALTATVNDLVPKVVKTMNDQAAIIAALRAGQQPAMDPDKVEADVQAINQQLAALATAEQNDAPPVDQSQAPSGSAPADTSGTNPAG